MESDSLELECRICRGNSEEGRPLYHPCKCNGSIGLVHQDCLEAWLEHSSKDRCELCSVKYTFEPLYDENAPDVLPLTLILRSFLKFLFSQAIPMMFRMIFVTVVWLGFVPISTLCFYKTFMRSNTMWGIETLLTKETICYGLVLDALIALSLLIIMSFTDFIRFHWVPDQPIEVAPQVGVEGIADPAHNNNALPPTPR
ncbi:hypothetical protein EON64_13310 [archaeon]|nr:MAG: hypothetical protein EON64_13310 [archaeon]